MQLAFIPLSLSGKNTYSNFLLLQASTLLLSLLFTWWRKLGNKVFIDHLDSMVSTTCKALHFINDH